MVTQPATGDTNSNFGFWSSLLVAPQPPVVKAGQGEQADRIQITWEINPLGSYPIGGFKIYRDGIFLAQVDKNTRNYNDFNVIAGTNYTYSVRGVNNFGDGPAGTALGFQVPNGVATGWVRTLNGNPVPDALVALSPMQGYSVRYRPVRRSNSSSRCSHRIAFFTDRHKQRMVPDLLGQDRREHQWRGQYPSDGP